jgi:hypothetical protein
VKFRIFFGLTDATEDFGAEFGVAVHDGLLGCASAV